MFIKLYRGQEVFFQSRDLEDWESKEAQMCVCVCLCLSQKIIRFKSMNSYVNAFLEWQKQLVIHESDKDLIDKKFSKMTKNLQKAKK